MLVWGAYLAAGKADCDDAEFIAGWEEFWLEGWCGRHGGWWRVWSCPFE